MTLITSTAGWIYPGSTLIGGQSDVPVEYSDGRMMTMMKPQYFTCDGSGNLQLATATSTTYAGYTCVNSGVDGYTPANAAAVKLASLQQFITISGGPTDITALAASSGLRSTFNTTCINLLNATGFTGIEFDLEAGWSPARTYGDGRTGTQHFNDFKTLCASTAAALHTAGYTLMVSGPGIGVALESAYAFSYAALEALTPPPDYYSPQVYDHFYDTDGGGIADGGAPFAWITDVCNMFIAQVSNLNKVFMGITNEAWAGVPGSYAVGTDSVHSNDKYYDYSQISAFTGFNTATRDPNSGEMTWNDGTYYYQYADSTTLNQKLTYILASGFSQIGVWHLGGGGKWFTSQFNPPQLTPALNGAVVKQDSFGNRTVNTGLTLGNASGGGTWNTLASGGSTATKVAVYQGEGTAWYDNSGLSNGYAEVVISGNGSTDTEVLCRFCPLSTGSGHFGLFTRYVMNSQWYRCNINTGANWVSIEHMAGGTYTPSTTLYSVTINPGTYYWVRFRTAGTTQQVKVWADGSAEPGSWLGTETDSSVTANGQVGMMLVPVSTSPAGGLQFDNFSAVTIGSSGSSAYETLILGNGPTAYYRLGEASGTSAIDSSGNGYTATITGSGVTYAQSGALSGDTNTALLFNGSTGDIACPSGFNPTGWSSFTVEAWIKLSNTTFSTNPRIAANSHTDVDKKGFQFFVVAGGAGLHFDVGNGTTFGSAQTTFAFAANTWYHVAGTYNGSILTVYVNGVSKGTASYSTSLVSSGHTVGIAYPSAYTTSDYFPGTLDEVAFYHSSLTASTLLNDYAVGSGNSTSYIYLVSNGNPILHQDFNQAIYIQEQISGAQEKGKYHLGGNAYATGGFLSLYERTLSQNATPVSVSIDTADTAASGMNAPTALNLTSYGFRIHSTSTGAVANIFGAGNYTVSY